MGLRVRPSVKGEHRNPSLNIERANSQRTFDSCSFVDTAVCLAATAAVCGVAHILDIADVVTLKVEMFEVCVLVVIAEDFCCSSCNSNNSTPFVRGSVLVPQYDSNSSEFQKLCREPSCHSTEVAIYRSCRDHVSYRIVQDMRVPDRTSYSAAVCVRSLVVRRKSGELIMVIEEGRASAAPAKKGSKEGLAPLQDESKPTPPLLLFHTLTCALDELVRT